MDTLEIPHRLVSAREAFDAGILLDYHRGKNEAELDEKGEAGLRTRKAKFNKILETDPEFYLLDHCTNISAAWLSILVYSVDADTTISG